MKTLLLTLYIVIADIVGIHALITDTHHEWSAFIMTPAVYICILITGEEM